MKQLSKYILKTLAGIFLFLTILIIIFAFITHIFIETFSYRSTLKILNAHEKELSQNITLKKYNELCLIHSYNIGFNNSVKIENKIIAIPENNSPSPDDGIWVIIGISDKNKNKTYAIDHDAVLKYFDNRETQCKKL